MEHKNAWMLCTKEECKEAFALSEDYRQFISKCKTERECVTESVRLAKESGYRDLDEVIKEGKKLLPGDKIYSANMGKMLVLFQIGRRSVTDGMQILGAHIDSPRIDIKQNPLYEDSNMCLFDTHYYGGDRKSVV